jgi:hypothetical protein
MKDKGPGTGGDRRSDDRPKFRDNKGGGGGKRPAQKRDDK